MQTLKKLLQPKSLKQLTDVRNVGLIIFAVIVLAIAWSGVKAVQKNYELQKQIAALRQQNDVLRLTNQNTYLGNKYFETDQYLELSARQNFGLAAPGETVLLVPKTVAMKYIDQSLVPAQKTGDSLGGRSKLSRNFHDWRDFLLGRHLFDR